MPDLDELGLSTGALALFRDLEAGRISPMQFTRWAITKVGFLGDSVPAQYALGTENTADYLALSTGASQVMGAMSASDQATVQAAVDTYTHSG